MENIMKKIIMLIGSILLNGCSSELLYGSTEIIKSFKRSYELLNNTQSRDLEIAYNTYKDKELYCLGRCIIYNPIDLNLYSDNVPKYKVNREKGYVENEQGCQIIDDIFDLAKHQKSAPCLAERNSDENVVDGGFKVTVIGTEMGYPPVNDISEYSAIISGNLPHPKKNVEYLKVKVPATKRNIIYAKDGFVTKFIKLSDIGKGRFGDWGT